MAYQNIIFEVFVSNRKIIEAIYKTDIEGVDIIPASYSDRPPYTLPVVT